MFRQPFPQDRRTGPLALGLLALLAWATSCPAQNTTPPPEQAEQQQPQQSPICSRDEESDTLRQVDFSQAPVEPYTDAERACWVDWNNAKRLAAQGAQWVDVREAGMVQRLRLAGAWPVPSQEVTGKAALRGLNLLILGEDTDLRALSRQCVIWKQSGNFQGVHLVLGGVRAWRLAGQPVQPDARSASAPDQPEVVTPAEFRQGQADGLWRVVTLGVDPNEARALGNTVAMTISTDDAQALQKLQQALAQAHSKPANDPTGAPPSWLAVAADAQTQARLLALWNQKQQQAAAPTLLWLGGGLRAWRDYLTGQQQLAAHAGHALPRPCGM